MELGGGGVGVGEMGVLQSADFKRASLAYLWSPGVQK